jgi:hypothetical protein
MKAYVVVEGLTDAKLLSNLLPPAILQHSAIVEAGGRANLTSAARTLLVTRRKPLAVLVDADTVDESSVLDLRRETEEWIRGVSGGVPFKVFMMVPEIEALLFRAPAAVERITGQQLSADNMTLAKYKPHQVILQLGQNKTEIIEQIINGLTAEELHAIRETSPIKELIVFLSEKVATKQQPQTA